MKLWLCGDSFSAPYHIGDESPWGEIWGKSHGFDVENLSTSGCGNEHIMTQFMYVYDNASPGDMVIITWSALYRYTILNEDFDITDNYKHTTAHPSEEHLIYFGEYWTLNNAWTSLSSFIAAANQLASDKGIKIVQFMGHSDIKDDTEIDNRYLIDFDLRVVPKAFESVASKYCTKLDNTWCLLHYWIKMQTDMMLHEDPDWNHERHFNKNYVKYTHNLLDDFQRTGHNIFVDVWHLNVNGHSLFYKRIKNILDKKLL